MLGVLLVVIADFGRIHRTTVVHLMTSHERRTATGEIFSVAAPADAPRGARGARHRRMERVQGGAGVPSRALRDRTYRDCAHVERRQPNRHD